MPYTDSFLTSRRAEIAASAELAAFVAARAALVAVLVDAGSDSEGGLWQAAYGDNQPGLSPAYRLRRAIRDLVTAAAGSTLSPLEREEVYRLLVAEYVPTHDRPATPAEEAEFVEALLHEDAFS